MGARARAGRPGSHRTSTTPGCRRDRLPRAREQLREHDLPAALLCDPLNVRYAVVAGPFAIFNMHNTFRWALVPVESTSCCGSTPGRWRRPRPAGPATCARPGWTFFGSGSPRRAAAARSPPRWSPSCARGLAGQPLGVDRLETGGHLALAGAGVRVVDAQPALERARAVKTPDELTTIRANARACDRGIGELRAVLVPGVTENQLWATLVGSAFAGGRRVVRDPVAVLGARGPTRGCRRPPSAWSGTATWSPSTPTWSARTATSPTCPGPTCAATAGPRDEQRRLTRSPTTSCRTCLPELRPAASFEELGRRLGPLLPEEFRAQRYPFIAHGTGPGRRVPLHQLHRPPRRGARGRHGAERRVVRRGARRRTRASSSRSRSW